LEKVGELVGNVGIVVDCTVGVGVVAGMIVGTVVVLGANGADVCRLFGNPVGLVVGGMDSGDDSMVGSMDG
jgi:hypothetical protein